MSSYVRISSESEKKSLMSTPATTPSRKPTKINPVTPTPAIRHINLRALRPNPNTPQGTKSVFKIGPPKGKRRAKSPVAKPQIVAEPPLTPESIAPEVPPSSSPQSLNSQNYSPWLKGHDGGATDNLRAEVGALACFSPYQ